MRNQMQGWQPAETAKRRGGVLALSVHAPHSVGARESRHHVALPQAPIVSGSLALLEAPNPQREPVFKPVPARRRILIVEDDPRMVDVLRNVLELEGEPDWCVESTGDGGRALALAAETPPDVVLLDVRLPGLDGGEVYRRLRASGRGHTRVLFLSAGTALDLARYGIEDGVLLRKPLELPLLMGLLRALLMD